MMSKTIAQKPKIKPASASLLRTFRSAASQRFLDDDRVVMSILGKQAAENGGERCSIVSLADEKETVIDPNLYARGNPGMLAVDAKRGRILFAMVDTFTFFDAKTGAPLERFATGGSSTVLCACFSPDGTLACVGSINKIEIWDTSGGSDTPGTVEHYHSPKMPRRTPAHSFEAEGSLVRAQFSADGALLAMSTGSLETGAGALQLWSTKDEQIVATTKFEDPITGLDFAPDGESIVLATTTARRRFGNRIEGQSRIHVVDRRGQTIRSAAVEGDLFDLRCLDGGRLVTIDEKSVAIVDAESGEILVKRAQKAAVHLPRIADVRGNRVLTVGPMGLFTIE
jgi:hypothetical protein